jgi:hypothetical protein
MLNYFKDKQTKLGCQDDWECLFDCLGVLQRPLLLDVASSDKVICADRTSSPLTARKFLVYTDCDGWCVGGNKHIFVVDMNTESSE